MIGPDENSKKATNARQQIIYQISGTESNQPRKRPNNEIEIAWAGTKIIIKVLRPNQPSKNTDPRVAMRFTPYTRKFTITSAMEVFEKIVLE